MFVPHICSGAADRANLHFLSAKNSFYGPDYSCGKRAAA